MNEQEKLFDKIEDYLLGKLPEAEVKAFEQAIATDPQLAMEVKKHSFEHLAMEEVLAQELREKMKTWKTEDLRSNKQILPKYWRLFTLFCLVIIALISFVFYNQKIRLATPESLPKSQEQTMPNAFEATDIPGTPDALETPAAPEAIKPIPPSDPRTQENPIERAPTNIPGTGVPIAYADEILAFYQQPEHLQVWLRSSDRLLASPVLDAALKAYENKNYSEAIQLLVTSSETDYRNELLAHAYFENRNYAQAAALFRDMTLVDYESVVQDRMEWNLLLSLLMEGTADNEEAHQLLDKIIQPENHHYYKDSGEKLAAVIGKH